jgi:pSer/pThr/pTyr-binding forkhead associated (FHA) protein
MAAPGASRRQLVQTLTSAYGAGLLSDKTFAHRIDLLLTSALINPRRLVGDLNLRRARPRFGRLLSRARTIGRSRSTEILALDWSGGQEELVIGRHQDCDVVLPGLNVSRQHARLDFRDGRWVLRDLESTNGTAVNGVRVGRSELRPGDEITIGSHRMRVD